MDHWITLDLAIAQLRATSMDADGIEAELRAALAAGEIPSEERVVVGIEAEELLAWRLRRQRGDLEKFVLEAGPISEDIRAEVAAEWAAEVGPLPLAPDSAQA